LSRERPEKNGGRPATLGVDKPGRLWRDACDPGQRRGGQDTEFILRRHEDPELGRAPLKELTAQLLEPLSDLLLVSHRRNIADVWFALSGGERYAKVLRDRRATFYLGCLADRVRPWFPTYARLVARDGFIPRDRTSL